MLQNVLDFKCMLENINSNDSIILDKEEEFHVFSDESKVVNGYNFSNTSSIEENPLGTRPVFIYLKDKKNVTIDGHNSKIIIHGIMTPFLFDNCENLTFKNFYIDYARPTMNEFKILEKIGDKEYIIKISDESLYDIKDNRIIWHGEVNRLGNYYYEYDYRDQMVIAVYLNEKEESFFLDREDNMRFPPVPEFESIIDLGSNKLKVKLKNKDALFMVGTTIQSRYTVRDQIGGAFIKCKNVLCENLTIKAMHGFGILSQFTDGITYRGIDINPKPGRTIASNADFFHFSGCKGEILIEQCNLSHGHDDFVNVHGTHLIIKEVNGRNVIATFKNDYSRGFEAFYPKDEIEFIDRKTLLPYAKATIKNVSMLNDRDFSLELMDDVDIKIGDAIENATWTPKVTIRNNYFGPSMGRGILATTRKEVLIENNTFYKVAGQALLIEDDCNFWFESGYVTDVTFRNNIIESCSYCNLIPGSSFPVIAINPQVLEANDGIYPHKKIRIQNNTFKNLYDDSYRINVKNTEYFEFTNNISDKHIDIITHSVKKLKRSNNFVNDKLDN